MDTIKRSSLAESGIGTKRTCPANLTMSVCRARPEVLGARSERRDWPSGDIKRLALPINRRSALRGMVGSEQTAFQFFLIVTYNLG
jgi:hypothetical protein